MKKNFITGLVILLPLALTIAVVLFVLRFLTDPFIDLFEGFLDNQAWFTKYYSLIHFFIQVLLLVCLFLFTVLLGFVAKAFIFKSILNINEYILNKIPIINTLYKTSKQVIKTIFGSSSKSFKQVVMVPFPNETTYCIGFLSGDAPIICSQTIQQAMISVFVPTTPNPTSGFLLLCPADKVKFLDMKVDEAFKLIISCGVIVNPTDIQPS